VKGRGNPEHFIVGGQGALCQDSNGKPWNGDYVFSSGDLVEDLTHPRGGGGVERTCC
jgi:Mn-containing catalase